MSNFIIEGSSNEVNPYIHVVRSLWQTIGLDEICSAHEKNVSMACKGIGLSNLNIHKKDSEQKKTTSL